MPRPRPSIRIAALAACFTLVGVGAVVRAEEPVAPADSSADLAPTAAVPWNPPRPVPTHETWEQVLNAPLTLVSLPFRALGALTEAGLLRVQEDRLVPKVQYGIHVTRRSGVIAGAPDMGERSGFGGAIGYAPPPLHGWLRGSLAGTFRHYHRGSLELGPPALSASYAYDWRPEEPFHGLGAEAREADVSDYAMQAEQAGLRATLRGGGRMRHELSAWAGERQSVLRSGREAGRRPVEVTFPALAAGALDVVEHHWMTGARVALDTRAGHPHWSHGWRIDAQAERFEPVSGDGLLFTGRQDSPGFHRFTLSGQVGWSFMRDPRTLRLAARVVDIAPFDGSAPPSLFDLSRLGGRAGLAGFEPGRFHDLDLVLLRLDYIFPLVEYAEMQLVTELGAVSGDVWRATRGDRLEPSYGVLVRPRMHTAPLGALGVNWSREGARFTFTLGGVE